MPSALGTTEGERVDNLAGMLDGYFCQGGHHINVNVFDRDMLLHAMDHPELYPQWWVLPLLGIAVIVIGLLVGWLFTPAINGERQKLQFISWPLEAGSKNKSIPIDPNVKMPNFTAEINMSTVWYINFFGL